MWAVIKADIIQTVTKVCTIVLHDVSVSTEIRAKRAEAIFALGVELVKGEASVNEGLEEMLAKMCPAAAPSI
jgi:hypothetical protein